MLKVSTLESALQKEEREETPHIKELLDKIKERNLIRSDVSYIRNVLKLCNDISHSLFNYLFFAGYIGRIFTPTSSV